MGWPYQLSEIYDKSIVPDLAAFGRERGVRVWLWFHFNDFIDSAVYKRDFPMYAKWGLAKLKIDFIDRSDQRAVNWYEDNCAPVGRPATQAGARRRSCGDLLARQVKRRHDLPR